MQVKQENIYHDFTENQQNTHNTAISISAAKALYRLMEHYIQGQNHSPEIVVDGLITQISIEVEGQDWVKTAWAVIQKKINEDSGQLDIIRLKISEDEEPEEICFELKTVLATVYAALTDQTVYDNHSDEERNERVRSLFNNFVELQDRMVCHHGIRNQWAMLLHLVYPGVELVASLPLMMHRIASEYLTGQLFSLLEIEGDLSLFREVLLTELVIRNELITQRDRAYGHPWLKENLNFIHFQQKMKAELEVHGIEEDYFKEAIHTFWDSIEDVPLIFNENQRVFHYLNEICTIFNENNVKGRNGKQVGTPQSDVLKNVLKWMYENFDPNDQSQADFLAMLIQANRVYDLLLTYGRIVSVSDSSQFSLDAVEALKTSLDEYYNHLQSQDFSIEALPDFREEMSMFEAVVSNYRENHLSSWVENFFVIWKIASPKRKLSYYQLFLDPLIQEKCYMNDDILSQIFDAGNEGEIQLTPYLINRIFLHGLMIHPAKWSDDFTIYFEQTLQFVSNSFNQETLLGTANSLKQDSYSTELLQQLEYLKNYKGALIANEVFQNAEVSFIPLPHLIQNASQLKTVLRLLPRENRMSFVERLEGLGENFIENVDQLSRLLRLLPQAEWVSFIKRREGLRERFITDFNQLTTLLELLPEEGRMPFVESLGEQDAANFIGDLDKLVKLLRLLPEGDRLPFAERLAPPGEGRIFLVKVQIALAEVEIGAAEERANELRGFLFDKAFCDLEYLRKKVEKTPSILESDFEFIQNFIRATVQLCNNFNSEDNLNEYVNLKKEAAGKGSWGKIIGGLVLTTVSLLLMVAFITVAAASLGASTPLSAFGIAIATDLMIAGVAAIATGGAAVSAVSGGFLAKSGRDIGFFKLMDDTEKVYRQELEAEESWRFSLS